MCLTWANSWHWWADVPVKKHDRIFALPKPYQSKEPSIKYRGIFINDEAPALTGMVLEKFGKYGKEFHIKVFDLLLRLKVIIPSANNLAVSTAPLVC